MRKIPVKEEKKKFKMIKNGLGKVLCNKKLKYSGIGREKVKYS